MRLFQWATMALRWLGDSARRRDGVVYLRLGPPVFGGQQGCGGRLWGGVMIQHSDPLPYPAGLYHAPQWTLDITLRLWELHGLCMGFGKYREIELNLCLCKRVFNFFFVSYS